MDDVNVLRLACSFRNLFLSLVKMDPFRQAVTVSSIYNKVFPTMFLKPDAVGIIPKGGTKWEIASLLKLFNGWRTSAGRETMLLMPEMDGRSVWHGFLIMKVDGYFAKTNEGL
jgi:hypothetical protein